MHENFFSYIEASDLFNYLQHVFTLHLFHNLQSQVRIKVYMYNDLQEKYKTTTKSNND